MGKNRLAEVILMRSVGSHRLALEIRGERRAPTPKAPVLGGAVEGLIQSAKERCTKRAVKFVSLFWSRASSPLEFSSSKHAL